MEKQRIESSGLITSYNCLDRTMTLLNSDKTLFRGNFNQTMLDYPTRVVLEIESYCSSGCKYCSEGEAVKCRNNISKNKLISLIDEIEDMNIHEVTIRGGGEATEHPDFEDIWEYASSKKSIASNILTNGMNLNLEKSKKFLKNKTSKLMISLDGFKETNSQNRNSRQYGLVMSWLPNAISEHPEQIGILSCLYRQNYNEIPSFAKFLAKMGLEHYHLPPLKRLGRSEIADENFVSLKETNKIQSDLDEISKEFPRFKPVVSCVYLDKFKYNKNHGIPVPLFNEIHYGTGLKITPSGEVMVNRGIMFTERFKKGVTTEISLEPLGNIHEKSLREIWDKTKKIRIEQGKLADKHYSYYLGWLKELEK
ncbi:MAG: radical SAM protein [Nanoarchaeota archaeon]